MDGLNAECQRRWDAPQRRHRGSHEAHGLLSLRYFGRFINRNERGSPIERHRAGHSRLHLILLRAMAGIALAMGMAWRWTRFARLNDAARKTSCVGERQCDGQQD